MMTNPTPFPYQACGDCGRSAEMHTMPDNGYGACDHFMFVQEYYDLCKEANESNTRTL